MLLPDASVISEERDRGAPSYCVIETDFRDRRWAQFISTHPDALIYHHPGWLSALESEFNQRCVSLACVDGEGRFCAILPLFYTKGLPAQIGDLATGPRLSSLPRTPIAGPLSTSEIAAAAIVEYAVELVRSRPGVRLEIKTQIPNLNHTVDYLNGTLWRPTYVSELPPAVDGCAWQDFWENLRLPRACVSCQGCRRLRFGNARRQHRVNWAVNKAIKLGLTVREADDEEDLKRWYKLYLLTMRNNSVPPRPYRFFHALWAALLPAKKLRLLIADRHAAGKTRMVAGSILLQFGQTVFYAFTGCAPEDLPLHAHDILQIEAIRGACRAGFRWYDFGEVTEDHQALAQFKTKWSGDPAPLYRYYHPAPLKGVSASSTGFGASVRKLWRSLPLKATEVLGELIYSRL